MFCGNCRKEIKDVKFCPYCGTENEAVKMQAVQQNIVVTSTNPEVQKNNSLETNDIVDIVQGFSILVAIIATGLLIIVPLLIGKRNVSSTFELLCWFMMIIGYLLCFCIFLAKTNVKIRNGISIKPKPKTVVAFIIFILVVAFMCLILGVGVAIISGGVDIEDILELTGKKEIHAWYETGFEQRVVKFIDVLPPDKVVQTKCVRSQIPMKPEEQDIVDSIIYFYDTHEEAEKAMNEYVAYLLEKGAKEGKNRYNQTIYKIDGAKIRVTVTDSPDWNGEYRLDADID